MFSRITYLLVAFALFTFVSLQAQTNRIAPITVVAGDEMGAVNADVIQGDFNANFSPVETNDLTFDVHPITDIATGYDLQSNASTEEVWFDLNTGFVHSIFTNSQNSGAGWPDRTTLYFFSADAGLNWVQIGPIPPDGSRSGFPAISGNSIGAAVITNHSNTGGNPTRTQIFIDDSPAGGNFTTYDPGVAPDGAVPIWPRLTVDQNDNVIFASSEFGGDSAYTNTLDGTGLTFSGYQVYPGDQAETHGLAVSDGGLVGLAYISDAGTTDRGDVFYKESDDGGLSWSDPVKVFDATSADTGFGAIRGVSCSFTGENPAVVWEDAYQIFSSGNFFPSWPSHIWFWSPNVNGGAAMVLADSSNVPYAPNIGTNDVQVPVCRPVIGRSQVGSYLFVAFDVSTNDVFPSADSTTYFAGYFTYSMDAGNTWSTPVKFTPDAPLRDWRYPSIAPVNPVDQTTSTITVHMVMQGDSIPGSTVNASGMPVGVTAHYYHFSTTMPLVGVGDDENNVPSEFVLEQNYPNPFNPSTTIKYTLAEKSDVSLNVYDILGNEVATLVNATQEAGNYEINFNASNLASGLYLYKIKAGNFVSTKKMMLLK